MHSPWEQPRMPPWSNHAHPPRATMHAPQSNHAHPPVDRMWTHTSENITVIMRKEQEVYSVSCIGMLPFIEGSLRDGTSGLVAVSRDSEEHA